MSLLSSFVDPSDFTALMAAVTVLAPLAGLALLLGFAPRLVADEPPDKHREGFGV